MRTIAKVGLGVVALSAVAVAGFVAHDFRKQRLRAEAVAEELRDRHQLNLKVAKCIDTTLSADALEQLVTYIYSPEGLRWKKVAVSGEPPATYLQPFRQQNQPHTWHHFARVLENCGIDDSRAYGRDARVELISELESSPNFAATVQRVKAADDAVLNPYRAKAQSQDAKTKRAQDDFLFGK